MGRMIEPTEVQDVLAETIEREVDDMMPVREAALERLIINADLAYREGRLQDALTIERLINEYNHLFCN